MRYAARKPTVIASWYKDTNAPLFSAIAISEMYIGQTMDTMPIPKPPIILYITKSVNPTHSAQPIAEMLNRTEAMNIVFFLPRLSLSTPAIITPSMEPMRAQPTYQPCCITVRPNWVVTEVVVPEITAVS